MANWRISIFEVEETLTLHPAIDDVAVVGVPGEMGEQAVVAFVSVTKDATLDEAELRGEPHFGRRDPRPHLLEVDAWLLRRGPGG